MDRRRFIGGCIGAVTGSTALTGCISSSASSGGGDNTKGQKGSIVSEPRDIGIGAYAVGYYPDEIKFTDAKLWNTDIDASSEFVGSFKNVSGRYFDSVSFEVSFMMEDESPWDRAMWTTGGGVEHVPPGAEYNFHFVYRGDVALYDSSVALIWDVDTTTDT